MFGLEETSYIFIFLSSLLEDADAQVVMKTLGLMRNLLSGRDVCKETFLRKISASSLCIQSR